MFISIAHFLRLAVEKIDLTAVGNDLVEKLQELKKEIPEINRGVIKDQARKTEIVDTIADSFIKVIEEKKGHGLKADKADEVIAKIEELRKINGFKGLITYPVNFALAFKYKVFADQVPCSQDKPE